VMAELANAGRAVAARRGGTSRTERRHDAGKLDSEEDAEGKGWRCQERAGQII
jgi:hypothetical protein